ncbi:MAG: hypothetical protein RLZ35_201 [Pseudomonadota bacterium]
MTIYNEISDFFCELSNFSYKRHQLLITRAKGKTAPLAATLAQTEYVNANEMYRVSMALQNLQIPNDTLDLDEYREEQHLISSTQIYSLSTQLMDSCDLNRLVFGLRYAKEFLRRDVLMDSVAVELIDNPTHHMQLEESTRLYAQVNHLLKVPKLASIDADTKDMPPPWMKAAEVKIDNTLQLYAFQQLCQKKSKLLEAVSIESIENEIKLESLNINKP